MRLASKEDVATAEANRTLRPLPEFPPARVANTTQRLRLRLDPEVATRPLPFPTTAAEPASRAMLPPAQPAAASVDLQPEPPEAGTDEPVAQPELALDTISGEHALPEESGTKDVTRDQPEETVSNLATFELPSDTALLKKIWVPPGPTAAQAEPFTDGPAKPLPPLEVVRQASANSHPSLHLAPASPEPTSQNASPPSTVPVRPVLRRPAPSLAHLSQPADSSALLLWLIVAVAVLVFAGVLACFVVLPRLNLRFGAAAAPAPVRVVSFVTAVKAIPVVELPVTGTVEPSRETAIYARTSGYVRDWLADLGDKVQAGQVLAELDTPEVDHQLVEARAAADQARASLALAQNEADRFAAMAATHAVSQQDADAKIAARNEAQANVNAADANVGRLADLEMFKEIRAPYAGTITARNLEVGTLVGTGPAGSELFHLIETDPVRVFVNVPEGQAPGIRPGVPAKLQVEAYPGRVFTGQVVRDAGALDPQTHELRTEVHVANPDGALLPGTLANVHLLLMEHEPALLVPTSALVMIPGGAAVERIVPAEGREVVRLTQVQTGRAFGSQVEVLSALQDGDRVVASPAADLQDGMVVDARPYVADPPPPTLLPPHPSAPRA